MRLLLAEYIPPRRPGALRTVPGPAGHFQIVRGAHPAARVRYDVIDFVLFGIVASALFFELGYYLATVTPRNIPGVPRPPAHQDHREYQKSDEQRLYWVRRHEVQGQQKRADVDERGADPVAALVCDEAAAPVERKPKGAGDDGEKQHGYGSAIHAGNTLSQAVRA